MAKLVLNMTAAEDNFFSDSAMIGIGTALPGYTFCWMLNNYFDLRFARDPEQNICLKKKDASFLFPVYEYIFPNTTFKYLLYKLKSGRESLLPEARQLDYLWMFQTADPEHEAAGALAQLRTISEVQLAQALPAEQLKNLSNLLL